ncbi:MAG: LytTR family transcriptional regulator [Treponema sp.]|nr:LytTR family transcriptional regulator [Treponema sp.]
MNTQIKIEKCDKPYCVIHTEAESDDIKAIAEKISSMDESGRATMLTGWDGDYCIQIKQNEIFRIYSMDKKVYLETEKENLLLKLRLYEFAELAEKCGWTDFIRISNTDIVNFSKVTNLDMSLTGIVRVNFTNGKSAIVSRRYMSKIKRELLNLKNR